MLEGLVLKFIKFSVVGAIGLIIDFGITWTCKEKLSWNKYVSNSLGFSFAVVNNYLLNKYWTFTDHNPEIIEQFAKFTAISMIGLLINNLVIYILVRHINFYKAKILAIGIVVIWNFFMNYTYAFA
jgi:putative flippase GtrA